MKSFIKLSNQVLQSVPNLEEWIDKILLKNINLLLGKMLWKNYIIQK